MHFSSAGALSALSPAGARGGDDPIAELLSQLSGVRRGQPQPSQLQQLQMQIQLERQQVTVNIIEINFGKTKIIILHSFFRLLVSN